MSVLQACLKKIEFYTFYVHHTSVEWDHTEIKILLGSTAESIGSTDYCDRCYRAWLIHLYVCLCVVCHTRAPC